METALWWIVGLLAAVIAFQLYKWIEVDSAKRDMMRAYADAHRVGMFELPRLTTPPPPMPAVKKPRQPAKKRRRG